MDARTELSGAGAVDGELLLQELRSGRSVVVVDVRSKPEFCNGHIAGARLIPLHQLIGRTRELSTHADRIVLVSEHGLRARVAAAVLAVAGFEGTFVLEGGLSRWRELGHPVEDTSAEWSPSPREA